MKRLIELIFNEVRRNFYLIKTYKFAFVSNLIGNVIFIAIFLSIITTVFDLHQAFMMILWPIMIAVINSGSSSIQKDMQVGTLEQIISKTDNYQNLLLARIFSDGIIALPIVVVIGIFYIVFSADSARITIDILKLFGPLWVSGIGIGLFVCGLTLYHKNIGSTVNVLTLILLLCSILPWDTWGEVLKYAGSLSIPFLSMNIYAQSQENIFLLIAILNAVVVYVIGQYFFKSYYHLSKKKTGFIRY